jgi:hypothetical protein
MERVTGMNQFRQRGSEVGHVAIARRLLRGIPGAVVLGLAACYPGPVDPVGLPSTPPPFVRLPYVQQVTDSGASVLWMSQPGSADTAWYRIPANDSSWTRTAVVEHRYGTRRADFTSLPAASTVEYVVSAGGTRAGPSQFRTAPSEGTAGEDVRVLLFGDSGWGGPQQIDLARQMRRDDWDLSIHVGDIAYNDGSEEEFTERHFRVYATTFASTPFYPSVGNHDVRADGGRSYDGAFLWPEPFTGARYFSFRWGRIQFLSIDTSSKTDDVEDLRKGKGRQLEWLEGVLREASADSTVDWIITFQHHPLYSHAIGISGHELDRDLRAVLLPLYERYGVDLVTAGHDHHYERSWPVRENRRVPDGCGPVHVLSGGGGASRYARDITNTTLLATAQRVYQYVELIVGPDRIQGRVVDRGGQVVDEFSVRRYDGTSAGLPGRCSR